MSEAEVKPSARWLEPQDGWADLWCLNCWRRIGLAECSQISQLPRALNLDRGERTRSFKYLHLRATFLGQRSFFLHGPWEHPSASGFFSVEHRVRASPARKQLCHTVPPLLPLVLAAHGGIHFASLSVSTKLAVLLARWMTG